MILLVEGMPLCGKTTLARALQEDLKFPRLNFEDYNKHRSYSEYHLGLEEAIRKNGNDLIIEEFHIANRASSILNQRSWDMPYSKSEEFIRLENKLEEIGTLLICVIDSPDSIMARQPKYPYHNKLTRIEYIQLLNIYSSLMTTSKITNKVTFHLPLIFNLDIEGRIENRDTQAYKMLLKEIKRLREEGKEKIG